MNLINRDLNDYKISIIYQGSLYTGDKIKQQSYSQEILKKNLQTSLITYPADNRLKACFFLILGLNKQVVLTPDNSDYSNWRDSNCKNNDFIKKINLSDLHNIRLAIPTSGTESKPKIVLISYQNIISHCHNFNKIIPLNNKSIWLNCMPITHIAGIMIIYRCFFKNATMLLHDNFNPQKIWQDINRYKVTHISLVPAMLSRLLDESIDKNGHDSKTPKSLKYILVGGDILPNNLYQRAIKADWPIYISYGMTEATSTIAIGKSSYQLKILDGFKTELGIQNELKIQGAMVCTAMVCTDCLTKENYNNNLIINKLWLNTNDIVEIESGNLKVLGRNDDIIISGGLNIQPEYIEELILSSAYVKSFVSDLVITKQKDKLWGDTITAIVVGDSKKLELWVKENIKSCYRPRIFFEIDTIPHKFLWKKINRKKILQLVQSM